MDKRDMPHELEHACCWRCCSFAISASKHGLMSCSCSEYPEIKIEPNHFCNRFATSGEDRALAATINEMGG